MTTDISETIARVRKRTGYGDPPSYSLTRDEVVTLLAAAKAGMRAKELADACDDVGVRFFDTDTMEPEVQRMQEATEAVREILRKGAA